MAKKMVRYNGGRETYYSSSNPNVLKEGQLYEVVHEIDKRFQTNYILKGINGDFNSIWFDTVECINEEPETLEQEKTIYFAFSSYVPVEGERLFCARVKDNGYMERGVRTSNVKAVRRIEDAVYRVETRNSVYLVKVI